MTLPLGLLFLLSQTPAAAVGITLQDPAAIASLSAPPAPSDPPPPATPPCTPHTFLWKIDATEAELSQGDIVYLTVTPRSLDGKFLGHVVIAGDADAPAVQFLVGLRHKTVTVTVCTSGD